MLVGLYRECHVYRDLLPLTDLPVPHCYYTSVSDWSRDFLVLLSDGSYLGQVRGRVPSHTLGSMAVRPGLGIPDAITRRAFCQRCSTSSPLDVPESYIAVERVPEIVAMMKKASVLLSKMHAKFWGDYSLFARDLMLNNRDKLSDSFATIMASWEKTREKAHSGDYESKCGPWRGLPKGEWGARGRWSSRHMYPNYRWGLKTYGHNNGWRRRNNDTWRWEMIAERDSRSFTETFMWRTF